MANLIPLDRPPFVGHSAFAHKGGIHVSAVCDDYKVVYLRLRMPRVLWCECLLSIRMRRNIEASWQTLTDSIRYYLFHMQPLDQDAAVGVDGGM